METSQLICSANQLTGFYMMGTLVVKGLRKNELCHLHVYQRTSVELLDQSRILAIVNYRFLKSFSFLRFLPQTQVIVSKKQVTQAWAKSLKGYLVKMSSIMFIVLEYQEQKVRCASVLGTQRCSCPQSFINFTEKNSDWIRFHNVQRYGLSLKVHSKFWNNFWQLKAL